MKAISRKTFWIAEATLAFVAFCSSAQQDGITEARQRLTAHSPVLLQMVDQASFVAHVIVTNLTFSKYRTVTGDHTYTAACAVKEILKGPTNQTSVILKTRLIQRENLKTKEGSDYIVFVTALTEQRALLYPGDYLTDHWLGIQPFDPELLSELRAVLGKTETSSRPNIRQENQKQSPEDVRVTF